MARNADPHPEPDDPNEGPVPHFPPGTVPPGRLDQMPRPGFKPDEVPGHDYPPDRRPFPDHAPDPGVTHE